MSNTEVIKQDEEYKKYIWEKVEEYNTNGKKTIAFFCDTFYPIIDGVINVLGNYANLLKEKYNVVVFVPLHEGIVSKQDYLVVGTKSIHLKFLGYELARPNSDKFLKSVIDKLKIDIIHAHSPFSMGKMAAKTAKKKKVPFIITMHSQYKQDFYKYSKSKLIANILTKIMIKVYNRTDEVWTMNQKCVEILNSYGYKGEYFIIPNATDMLPYENLTEFNDYINEKYNIGKDQLLFVCVGRLVYVKNIHFLADALKIVNESGLDFRMLYVGGGQEHDSLQKHINVNGLQDKVSITGLIDREDLKKILARSDLFLFPSLYDTDGLVKIEAAAFNTPSVIIKGSAPAAVITDDVNGFLTDNSIESFANKVIEISKDRKKLKKVGLQAHKDLFITWPEVAEKASERYEYWMEKYKQDNK